ncbi:hypothetical protein B0J17DRAFT_660649 [Rhizoctonia solani]|nr:hypothetical protein B0J17DRAFT_660649 [Rhizoctonia solani]
MQNESSSIPTSRAGHWVLNFIDEAPVTSPDNPNETISSSTARRILRHPEFCFDNTLIAIQIEDTLFNVHKYQLVKSEAFSDMFKMPKPEGNGPEEGSSLEHPMVLKGVAASDFAALLTVLYASHFSDDQPAPEAPLIVSAFRLAHMFNFSKLRAHLLPLLERNLGDVDRIVFSREFDIKEWLTPAHVRLCQREQPLSGEEANKLGVQSTLVIMRIREQYRSQPAASKFSTGYYYCSSCAGMVYTESPLITCDACRTQGGGRFRFDGPSSETAQGGAALVNSTAIEVRVKKWVEDGCTMKD